MHIYREDPEKIIVRCCFSLLMNTHFQCHSSCRKACGHRKDDSNLFLRITPNLKIVEKILQNLKKIEWIAIRFLLLQRNQCSFSHPVTSCDKQRLWVCGKKLWVWCYQKIVHDNVLKPAESIKILICSLQLEQIDATIQWNRLRLAYEDNVVVPLAFWLLSFPKL